MPINKLLLALEGPQLPHEVLCLLRCPPLGFRHNSSISSPTSPLRPIAVECDTGLPPRRTMLQLLDSRA